jgi:hypothetical protein
MSEFTTALERELQRLESELRDDPRYRRINQIRALLTEYQDAAASNSIPVSIPLQGRAQVHVVATAHPRRVKRVKLSKAASVRLAVEQLLQHRGTTHRTEILKHLIDQKVMGNEKNPMAALAAYLSEFKNYFASDGRGNFSLRKSAGSGVASAPVSH